MKGEKRTGEKRGQDGRGREGKERKTGIVLASLVPLLE